MAFTSCTKDDTANDFSKSAIIKATFEQDATTRLNIATNNALTWSEDDAFALFNGETSYKFTLASGAGSATATFTGTVPTEVSGAAFPYTSEYNPAFDGTTTLSMTLPAELDQSTNGKCNLPMWAATTSVDNISFKHLAGVLRINLNDAPEGYNSLIVTASAPISGDFTADVTADSPVLVSESTADEDKVVEVSFTEATASANDNVLYIPIPAATYATIAVAISNGTDTKELVTYNNKTVERAKIYTASLTYSSVTGSIVTEVSSGEELAEVLVSGGSAVLTDDINLTETIRIPKDVNTSIDLNGRNITVGSALTRSGETPLIAIYVLKGASLTIDGEGSITATGNVISNWGGTVTINGGTYTTTGAQMATIYCDGASDTQYGVDSDWHLTINGGTFVSEQFSCISLQNNYYQLGTEGSATLNAGTFTSGGGWYDLYVGCAKATVDFDNCTFTNGKVYVVAETSLDPIAPAYINGIEYPTSGYVTLSSTADNLATAINNGGYIVLTNNIDLPTALSITNSKNVNINLNGKTVTANSTTAFQVLKKGASLTIGGEGAVTAAGAAISNWGGELTINGGTYTTTGDKVATIYCDGATESQYGMVDSDWHLIINGGTFVSEQFSCISLQNNYYQLNPEGSATLNAGTFTSGGGWYDLYVGCAKATVDFDNCTFTNGKVYAFAELSIDPTAPAYINGTEYSTSGLITF